MSEILTSEQVEQAARDVRHHSGTVGATHAAACIAASHEALRAKLIEVERERDALKVKAAYNAPIGIEGFYLQRAESAESQLAALSAEKRSLTDALLIAMRRTKPFHPWALRDPEGVWWDCDWCGLSGVWTRDRREIPVHPDNGCPIAILKAVLARLPADTGTATTQQDPHRETTKELLELAASIRWLKNPNPTDNMARGYNNGLETAAKLVCVAPPADAPPAGAGTEEP